MTSVTNNNNKLEKTELTIGFIPLTDCAPLVVAQEKGLFLKYGLNVSLSKETSWSNIRDKVAIGILDAAQMLAPMTIAMSLGLDAIHKPMITALSLDLNGNAITVSNRLYRKMQQTAPELMQSRSDSVYALKQVIDNNRAENRSPLTFAVVYPFSAHSYELRYWMASAGIDPDNDVKLVVVPPPQMPGQLENGSIDGYCVGEPWNSMAVHNDIGHTLITKYEIWNNSPEKVLGVSEEWALQNPNTHQAMIMAIIEASNWLDKKQHRLEVSSLIAQSIYVNAPEHLIRQSMCNMFQYSKEKMAESLEDFNVFHRFAANYPWRSHAEWFLSQMLRWGHITQTIDIQQTANRVYRADLYAQAAQTLGMAVPPIDRKAEGINSSNYQLGNCELGADLFFDNKIFDPGHMEEYLHQFEIKRKANPEDLLLSSTSSADHYTTRPVTQS